MFSTYCESHASDVPFLVAARLLRDVAGISGLDNPHSDLKANSARHPAWATGADLIWCRAPKAAEAIAELITMLVRFRTQAVASVTATLASTIESTIESRVSRLLGGDFFEKTSGA